LLLCSSLLCFFFSSRRRHTRFSRDWSSDVCSSDLDGSADLVPDRAVALPGLTDELADVLGEVVPGLVIPELCGPRHASALSAVRSEERRVGKEWRARWSPDHRRKTTLIR